jgi:2-methylcitrate dehydratase PrpD
VGDAVSNRRARKRLETAAAWVCGLHATDVPKDVMDLARAQRANIIASIFAGGRTRVGRAIAAALDRAGDTGPIVSLPNGACRSLLGAVYEHAALGSTIELDDFIFGGHTGQAAVGVSLALGQVSPASGEELLLAQVAANEVAGRLGVAMTTGPQHGHMKAYLHRAAASTAAARLLRLSEEQTVRALAVALAMPEFPLFPASFSPDTKALCAADPCTAGVRAALLAAEGLDAATDIVEHAVGLVTSLSVLEDVPAIWGRLGRSWSLHALSCKPVAACAYACAAALAVGEIVSGEAGRWDPARVRTVDVDSTALTVTMEGFSKPHRQGAVTIANVNFSTRRTVALAMLVGAPHGQHFAAGRLEAIAQDVGALTERVRLRHHWPHTLGMLRGVDAAIDHPGRPGIYGMAEAHKTMDRFRRAFDTPSAVHLRDLPAIWTLPDGGGRYLLRRYTAGLRARLPFAGGREARARYVSSETDLTQLSFRFSARVTVTTDDGKHLSHEVLVPEGFAGDAKRSAVPAAKLLREVTTASTAERARRLLALLERDSPATAAEIATCAAGPVGAQASTKHV